MSKKITQSRSLAPISHLDFRAVPEGHAQVPLAVDGHEVHRRPPKPLVEVRECRFPAAESFCKGIKRFSLDPLGIDGRYRSIVFFLHGIVAFDQFVVPLLILGLVLSDTGVLAYKVLYHVRQDLHLVREFALLDFKARGVADLLLRQPEIFEECFFVLV